MAELQRSQSDQGNNLASSEDLSHRSRASSIISTGTKFSVSTMPPTRLTTEGVMENSSRRSAATRPTSLYSVRSMASSLPPYEIHQPLDSLLLNGTSQDVPGFSEDIHSHDRHDVRSRRHNETDQPITPTDPENTLSMHYGRVVRTIDENHARQLARIHEDHERELAGTRNAIDEVYRKEFKAKNREIERIREEAANEIESVRKQAAADVAAIKDEIADLNAQNDANIARIQQENSERLIMLHEEYQTAIEKAKHAIEDLWEGRWHDRAKVVAAEAERYEAKRDAEWLKVMQNINPELVGDFKTAMHIP
ncbi:hypothetical protein ACLMJK_005476 [Lecanora helva]